MKVDEIILNANDVICKNIEKIDKSSRGLLSQNILSQLRNLVEHIAVKIYLDHNREDINAHKSDYQKLQAGIRFMKQNNPKFLSIFHKSLQQTASHYTYDEESSERLMFKYLGYLFEAKIYLKQNYDFEILQNIDKFPFDDDNPINEYQLKIVEKINSPRNKKTQIDSNRYYIQKIRPFFIENQIYYEISFTKANDSLGKSDLLIAFTKLDIFDYYALRLGINNEDIEVLGNKMHISIIDAWEVSIRKCELENFARIFNSDQKMNFFQQEYRSLMKFITTTRTNLADLMDLNENDYEAIIYPIKQESEQTPFLDILQKARKIIRENLPGCNILRYLLLHLNNWVIKQQTNSSNKNLSNLYLDYRSIPFDNMPFCTSLVGHNPRHSDIFECISKKDRKHELFARLIKNNTQFKGQLYTPKQDIQGFKNLDKLKDLHNHKLYLGSPNQKNRKLILKENFIHIKDYERSTIWIIKKLRKLSSCGVPNYSNSIASWLENTQHTIDCDEKREKLKNLFQNSKVALIYGSAGTGKSTMIHYISDFFNTEKKVYLAHTNPAVDNLRKKLSSNPKVDKSSFQTITKFLDKNNKNTECDLLVIDECSTVGNSNMFAVLRKATFKYLLLVGDTFQIESIEFGNWFAIAKEFIPKTSIATLTRPYRTKERSLITLWEKVRDAKEDILEHLITNGYSSQLNASIFDSYEANDQVILCLQYGGLYGINNINKFLQVKNDNEAIEWDGLIYKKGDPILFNESQRFGDAIYNNLKGKIIDIRQNEKKDKSIEFDIEVFKSIDKFDEKDFQLIGNNEKGHSIIRIEVNRIADPDKDTNNSEIVPFQVAYAVSIHKAQGLEYESVKIIIADEVKNMITPNIFYTAITRTKKHLRIYWSAKTEQTILENLQDKRANIDRDIGLLKPKIDKKNA